MSKTLRTVALVAGVVALAATGIGAIAGAGAALGGIGSFAAIARVASGVALAASIGAQATASKPGVKGSASQITIGADQAAPYAMGRTAAQLAQVHDVGYGGTVSDVPNPYRTFVYVASIGPIQGIEAIQADFANVAFSGGSAGHPAGAATGYYAGFLTLASQLGACPEAAALAGPYGAIPGWGAAYKLSGKAAFMLTAKFDKKGKVYASGLPQWGAIVNGVLVYDQRQDSTYPGGAGACRALNETTYVGGAAAQNPSCHGVTYALGRWQGSQGPGGTPLKVMGVGIVPARIDWPAWTEFANVCDANGWKIGGSVVEPGSRWDNLKRICAAGGGVPVWTGGLLSVAFPRPRVALDTINAADLADGELRIPAMVAWKDRINGIVPKYPSEANRWEMVQSDLVTSSTYVTEDRGNEKNQEVPYELVPYKDQAAQLAAYDLANGREIAGIVIPCKPRLMEYRIGDALEIGADLDDETDLGGRVLVITGRHRDPATCTITFTLATETDAKHAFALGKTGTAPPSPSLPTRAAMDEAVFGVVPSAPDPADWTLVGTSLSSAGGAIPALVASVAGGRTVDTDGLTGIQFDYRVSASFLIREGDAAGWELREDGGRMMLEDSAPGPWIGAMLDAPATVLKEIVSVTPGTAYDVSIQYQNKSGLGARLVLGPVEVGVLIPAESVAVGGFDAAALTGMLTRLHALDGL